MDLKLEDVAQLLSVSLETVEGWIGERKIPSYKIDGQYRFSRQEIESWMLQERELVEPKITDHWEGLHKFSLYRALNRGALYNNLKGKTKDELIRNAMGQMALAFGLDAAVLSDLLLDRERLMSTGMGGGIAIPHTRDFLLRQHFDIVTVVYPEEPIEFGAIDAKPVHTLFFLFACADTHHLELLAKLAHFANSEPNRRLLEERPTKQALLSHVRGWEQGIKSCS
ncbi:MAG: PTS sugar transporter subunit IIA [Verrucomicrobia bacterium]|nr:PTS sugar transporter subunit IIA [Verrucomicrobiota bacterium]